MDCVSVSMLKIRVSCKDVIHFVKFLLQQFPVILCLEDLIQPGIRTKNCVCLQKPKLLFLVLVIIIS